MWLDLIRPPQTETTGTAAVRGGWRDDMHSKKPDFVITPLRAGVLLLAFGLGGCSLLSDTTPGTDSMDYRSGATKTASLEVPPDLTPLARDGRYLPQSSSIRRRCAARLPSMYLSVVVSARCPASSCISRNDPPVFARTRAEVVMNVRLPECEEQPSRPR